MIPAPHACSEFIEAAAADDKRKPLMQRPFMATITEMKAMETAQERGQRYREAWQRDGEKQDR